MSGGMYQKHILDHYGNPRNWGRLEAPDMVGDAGNYSCGDQLRIELALDGAGRVADVAFEGEGCMISLASASIFTEHIKGMALEELAAISEDDVLAWLGVPVGHARRQCALMPLSVLREALAERERS